MRTQETVETQLSPSVVFQFFLRSLHAFFVPAEHLNETYTVQVEIISASTGMVQTVEVNRPAQ